MQVRGAVGVQFGVQFGVQVRGSDWPEDCTAERVAGAKTPEELDAWRLAWELRKRVFAFTDQGRAARDRDFCQDIRRAARSAPFNTAEGFYRFIPTEFRRFLRIARGSLGEVRDQLRDALDNKYISTDEYDELLKLANRAIGANTRLQNYLRSGAGPKDEP